MVDRLAQIGAITPAQFTAAQRWRDDALTVAKVSGASADSFADNYRAAAWRRSVVCAALRFTPALLTILDWVVCQNKSTRSWAVAHSEDPRAGAALFRWAAEALAGIYADLSDSDRLDHLKEAVASTVPKYNSPGTN